MSSVDAADAAAEASRAHHAILRARGPSGPQCAASQSLSTTIRDALTDGLYVLTKEPRETFDRRDYGSASIASVDDSGADDILA